MVRWCMPVELSRDWLVNLLHQCDDIGIRGKFDVEVMSYGHYHLPIPHVVLLLALKISKKTSVKLVV